MLSAMATGQEAVQHSARSRRSSLLSGKRLTVLSLSAKYILDEPIAGFTTASLLTMTR